eukprot:RCo027323
MPPDMLPALHDADPGTRAEVTMRLVTTALVLTMGLWAGKTLREDFLAVDTARILQLVTQEARSSKVSKAEKAKVAESEAVIPSESEEDVVWSSDGGGAQPGGAETSSLSGAEHEAEPPEPESAPEPLPEPEPAKQKGVGRESRRNRGHRATASPSPVMDSDSARGSDSFRMASFTGSEPSGPPRGGGGVAAPELAEKHTPPSSVSPAPPQPSQPVGNSQHSAKRRPPEEPVGLTPEASSNVSSGSSNAAAVLEKAQPLLPHPLPPQLQQQQQQNQTLSPTVP